MSADVGDPKRDPRPQDEDGTYRCYHDGCDREAQVAVPRRIESTRIDPVETAVTVCFRCYLAWEVLDATGRPLQTEIDIHESVSEECDTDGWVDMRAQARALCNLVLFEHPLGSDPPSDDSPLSDDWDHAGHIGEKLRELWETPVEEQLWDFDYPDTPDEPAGHASSDLADFQGQSDGGRDA